MKSSVLIDSDTQPSALGGRARPFDEELNHLFCCDENVALCGTDITAWTVQEDCDIDCAVCSALEHVVMSCGAPGCPEGGAE